MFGGHGRAFYDEGAMTTVGDRQVPQQIYVEVRGGTSEPDLGLKIEVRQGVPVYTELVLRARPDGPEIRDKDLSYVYLSDWLEEIVAACTWAQDQTGHWMVQTIGGEKGKGERAAAVANVRRVRTGRSRMSQEQLQKVAEVYREHIDTRPTQAVAAAFGKSDRMAARYVDLARKAGLLPPTSPGKKKA
ncbi:hypothetical protein B4U45_27885 [Mycobacterium persicum]|uniref:Uncharacterized protein n=1 Tax=Mycobacterium persicum TaxID=1487726 RepID=A0A8E2IXJ5_9MYCO|nr:hypothetical protein A4G31_26785 [Mycobacterium persicum]ORB39772.1 hypothetical protein BST40_22440 [Mycobacterium persicum]ORB97782.1 hypothetical protein B1T44_28370 [Mycobacterium persicum]ORC09851.1 hypothetical protein B4U45_27885 [Mycobacterium persicum]